MTLRILNRETREPVKVEKIVFWLGRPHIINDHPAHLYEFQQLDGYTKSWIPVEISFEE